MQRNYYFIYQNNNPLYVTDKGIQQLINTAKLRYPSSVTFIGKLTDSDVEKLEKECTVKTECAYISDICSYVITYKVTN